MTVADPRPLRDELADLAPAPVLAELRRAVLAALDTLSAVFPRMIRAGDTDAVVGVWCQVLAGVPPATLAPAVTRLLQRPKKFAPTPGELRAEALELAQRYGLDTPNAAPARPRFDAAHPEAACPICGHAPDVVAEWCESATTWVPARRDRAGREVPGHWASDWVRFRVTYPPPCPCWAHETRREVYRDRAWLVAADVDVAALVGWLPDCDPPVGDVAPAPAEAPDAAEVARAA